MHHKQQYNRSATEDYDESSVKALKAISVKHKTD